MGVRGAVHGGRRKADVRSNEAGSLSEEERLSKEERLSIEEWLSKARGGAVRGASLRLMGARCGRTRSIAAATAGEARSSSGASLTATLSCATQTAAAGRADYISRRVRPSNYRLASSHSNQPVSNTDALTGGRPPVGTAGVGNAMLEPAGDRRLV
ncbi:hypothetical protein FGB62_169g39 [Gracilaria domingensis]|nr:hypothetical protein FGB62_169g315 [Gracilaria domingensis]KAI0559094.1 hypothetical protein FGB62_169g39 [Gracilaria domingensis]